MISSLGIISGLPGIEEHINVGCMFYLLITKDIEVGIVVCYLTGLLGKEITSKQNTMKGSKLKYEPTCSSCWNF